MDSINTKLQILLDSIETEGLEYILLEYCNLIKDIGDLELTLLHEDYINSITKLKNRLKLLCDSNGIEYDGVM